MSDITIHLGSGNQTVTIDSQTMTNRLNAAKARLEEAKAKGEGDPAVIDDRIAKIDSQLAKIAKFDGQDVNITSDYANQKLSAGQHFLQEGMDALMNSTGENTNRDLADYGRLSNWNKRLAELQSHIDE